jgi:hypothetical protein
VQATTLKALIILVSIFVVLPILLFFLLRRLARAWLAPRSQHLASKQVVTPTGWAFYGCQVVVLLVGAAARELEPRGPLGRFLQDPPDIIAGFVLLTLASALAERALRKWGFPPTRVDERSDRGN